MSKVLIVEDEANVRDGLARFIRGRGHEVVLAVSLAEARSRLERDLEALDCILLDLSLSDGSGLDLLVALQDRGARVPVIVTTAFGDSDRTIASMKAGAFEYVTKPYDLDALGSALDRALRVRVAARAPAAPPGPESPRLVGTSAGMLEIWKAIGRVARSSASVLVVGETGTGKELVARAIHEHSERAAEPFVAVNLASLAPSLIESELFGHEKGAFTGALARHAGRFEVAGNGTIFLDEIGDLDPALQTKLLRVLQDGGYERVGGSGEPLTNRARVIAATNKAVKPHEPDAALRSDLYFRLAVVEIALPPLRARRSDIPQLVASALQRSGKVRAASEEAMAILLRYDWPGNIRELENVIARAVVMCVGEVLDVGDLPPALRGGAAPADESAAAAFDGVPLRDALSMLERQMLTRALSRANGNRAEAARALGIARQHLYAKLAEHGIATKRDPAEG